jgi:hypothetical protein
MSAKYGLARRPIKAEARTRCYASETGSEIEKRGYRQLKRQTDAGILSYILRPGRPRSLPRSRLAPVRKW